jgi:Restriction endonuclease
MARKFHTRKMFERFPSGKKAHISNASPYGWKPRRHSARNFSRVLTFADWAKENRLDQRDTGIDLVAQLA